MAFSFLNVYDVSLNDSNIVFWHSFAFCFTDDFVFMSLFLFSTLSFWSLKDLSRQSTYIEAAPLNTPFSFNISIFGSSFRQILW